VELSGESYALAALPTRKEPSLRIEYGAQNVSGHLGEVKIFCTFRRSNQNCFVLQSV